MVKILKEGMLVKVSRPGYPEYQGYFQKWAHTYEDFGNKIIDLTVAIILKNDG